MSDREILFLVAENNDDPELTAILGYAIDNIRTKIADLRELGFADPVKMITSSPAILSISRERLALVCRIVLRLEDGTDKKISQLIMKRRALLDAIDVAKARTWAEVRAMLIAPPGAEEKPTPMRAAAHRFRHHRKIRAADVQPWRAL